MIWERYVVVEGPDGSLAIAFNQEVQHLESQAQMSSHDNIVTIEYNKNVQITFEIYTVISLFKLVSSRGIFDVINFIFITTSTYAVHSEKPVYISFLIIHIMYSLMVVPTLGFMHMWWDLVYSIGCIILCSASLLTMKRITSFQLEP